VCSGEAFERVMVVEGGRALGVLACAEGLALALRKGGGEMAGAWSGKVVRHRCGYALSTRLIGAAEWAGQVVVEYSDGGGMGLVVYACPACGKPLKVWWPAPDGVSQAVCDVWSLVGGRGSESEVGL